MPSLFALAERQIAALYDAGVMSPAVLHHLVAAYADSGIDWTEEGTLQTVDGHSVQEAVVLVMMPARGLKSAQKDFMSIVGHLASSASRPAKEENEEREQEDDVTPQDDESLLDQLSGNDSSPQRKPRRAAGFNPLVGARAVPTRNKR